MNNSSRILFFIVTLAVWIAAGKADASLQGAPAGVDVKDYVCGLNHGNAEETQTPERSSEDSPHDFIGPVVPAQPVGTVAMKCHLAGHRHGGGMDEHECLHMKCLDPTSPAGFAGVLLSAHFGLASAHVDSPGPEAMKFFSSAPFLLDRHDSPEPRPPASVTV